MMAIETRSISRGFLYQVAAKASFVLGGYVVHLGLGRYLGPSAYGTVGIVLSITNILRILVMNSIRQAVSRLTATSDISAAGYVRRKGFQAQAVFVAVGTLTYLSLVNSIGSWLGDDSLVPYLRLAGLFIPLAGFYVIYVSSLNGMREFGWQAAVIIIYNVVRVVASLGLVLLGFHINGAVSGLLLACLAALIAGWLICRGLDKAQVQKSASPPVIERARLVELASFGFPMLLYAVGSSVLLNLDLFFVKRIVSDASAAGVYSASMALGQSLYYMAQVFVEVLFPSVGAISSRASSEETAAHIRRWLRYAFLVLLLGASLLSTSAQDVIAITYSATYAEVAQPLVWLSWGMCFYSLFIIMSNIVAALGRPWLAASLAIGPIPLSALLNLYLVPKFGLSGAAAATTATLFIITALTALGLSALVACPIDILSVIKAAIAALLTSASSLFFGPRLGILGSWTLCLTVYLSVLIVLKEVTRNDWLIIKRMMTTRWSSGM